MEMITEKVNAALDVSKVKGNNFRFTGIYIKKVVDEIENSIGDYAESLEEKEIREDR